VMRFVAFGLHSYDTWQMRLKTTLIVLLLSAALSETAAARQVESAAIEVRVLDLQQSELKTVQ
jgi:hypothetical protein